MDRLVVEFCSCRETKLASIRFSLKRLNTNQRHAEMLFCSLLFWICRDWLHGFLSKKSQKIHFGTSSEAVGSSIYAVVHTWPGDHMRSVEENSVVREWRKLFADLV